MNLICFLPPGHQLSQIYAEQLDGIDKSVKVERFETIADLAARLARPPQFPRTALLVAPGQEHLRQLRSLGETLFGLPLVVVVPDESDASLSLGHQLAPRLLASPRTEPDEVLMVAVNLLRTQVHKRGQWIRNQAAHRSG